MNDEIIDFEEGVGGEVEELVEEQKIAQKLSTCDGRQRVEEKLEELAVMRLHEEYDFY